MTSFAEFIQLDLGALLTACFSAVACALVGNFLVLRRQSLMGDAIAHAVLPGLALAFLVAGTRSALPMFLGALAAGALCALVADGLRRVARVEAGAAMGVAFSAFFAAGVVLMSVLPQMRHVDLDADCVLNGTLELVTWPADAAVRGPWSAAFWAAAPRQLVTAAGVCVTLAVVIAALYKELRLVSFDPALAAALGFRPGWVGTLLVLMTAAASVASFEAVGSILVIAMLIAPPAAARMLTDRLRTQIVLSAVIALGSAVAGYAGGAVVPAALTARGVDAGVLGIRGVPTVSAAGSIAVAAGLALVLAMVLAPQRGAVARALRRRRLTLGVAREDLLALMYRVEEARERGAPTRVIDAVELLHRAGHRRGHVRAAARAAAGRGEVRGRGGVLTLTDAGRDAARALVRTHRLWELYLVEHLGHRADHVHRTAMDLEHHTGPEARAALEATAEGGEARPGVDPHGRPIPPRG